MSVKTWGDFEVFLDQSLGRGGMGAVYRGRQISLDRPAAIKLLKKELTESDEFVKRFQREASLLAKLVDVHVVQVFGAGKADESHFYAMEFVEGEDLAARIKKGHKFGPEEVLRVADSVGRALQAAWRHRIIHRDIKPSNIVLTARGPKILDFGLAKTSLHPAAASIDETRPGVEQLTEVGGTVGTIAYMSPEQIRGEELDARSDIFSLGLVLYEMVAGRPAFGGPTPMAIAAAILHDQPRPLSGHHSGVVVGLEAITRKMLEKDRILRYQSALDVRTDLQRFARTSHPVAITPTRTTIARRRWLVAAAMLAVGVAGGALLWTRASQPDPSSGPKSIVVLPFTDSSPGRDQQSFADGLTVTLINAFARLPDLEVRGQESSFAFRDRNDLRVVGDVLNVDYVVTGNVLKAGDRLRVFAALEDVRTGSRIWSNGYDQPFTDIFEIHDQITKNVSRDLGVTLGLGENAQPGMTRHVEAFIEYVEGVGLFKPTSATESIPHFRRAVQLDSNFWQAHLALREAALFSFQFLPQRADELKRTAAEALAAAQRQAPGAPRVLAALADQRMRENRWLEHGEIAQKLFSHPEARFPNGMPWEGIFLLAVGKARQAVAPLQRARDEDPLMPVRAIMYAIALEMTGRQAAALEEINAYHKLAENDVAHGTAMLIAMSVKDVAEIQRRSAILSKSSLRAPLEPLGLDKFQNDPTGARDAINKLAGDGRLHDSVNQSILANWAAYYGHTSLALDLLKKAVQMPTYNPSTMILWRPNMREVRKLPGFKDIVRDLGYIEYWRKYGWGDFCRPAGDDFVCE